jgi:hypothetical protein
MIVQNWASDALAQWIMAMELLFHIPNSSNHHTGITQSMKLRITTFYYSPMA